MEVPAVWAEVSAKTLQHESVAVEQSVLPVQTSPVATEFAVPAAAWVVAIRAARARNFI